MAAMPVSDGAPLPGGWSDVLLPARRYAVFRHAGDLTTIRETIHAAGEWLERSEQSPEASAAFLERYGPGFDAAKGAGDIEVWMPLKN